MVANLNGKQLWDQPLPAQILRLYLCGMHIMMDLPHFLTILHILSEDGLNHQSNNIRETQHYVELELI